jgi:hypothetical protein
VVSFLVDAVTGAALGCGCVIILALLCFGTVPF